MPNHQEQLRELLDRYISGDLTPDEEQKLAQLLHQPENEPELERLLRESFMENKYARPDDADRTARFLAGLHEKIQQQEKHLPTRRRRLFYLTRIAAAAAVIFVLTGIGYLLIGKKDPPVLLTRAERFKNDVPPGHYGAMLTSSKGAQILLDSARNGALPGEDNVSLVKNNDELIYTGDTHDLLYNTVSTPLGRQWRLTLSDGTKVWLDALSSIRYPVSFRGIDRPVEITGEAYFEVAKNATHPFKVKVNGAEITVLGTAFNVNAYGDEEAMRTTLLEGSIRVNVAGAATLISPGQQIAISPNGKPTLKEPGNMEEVVAWKNDRFEFNDAPIDAVLRQLARWYDVEIHYENKGDQFFIGRISRNEPLSKVLELLELTGGVHFRIEGKKVTVMK